MTHTGGRFAHIDAMRALAVMLVVVSHAGLQDRVPGGLGVTMFFSISGFIITYLLLKERGRTGTFNIGSFYTRRALKILPPLLIVVIIPTVILSLFKKIDWSPVAGIIFFYYNWLKVHDISPPLPGSVVVWSLSIEEQFYLLFAVIWAVVVGMNVGKRWITTGVITVAVASIFIRILIVSTSPFSKTLEDRIYYGSVTRVDAIAFGILTATAFYYATNQPDRKPWITRITQRDSALALALILFLSSLFLRNEWFRYTFRFSVQALAACIIILYGFGNSPTVIRRAFNSTVDLRAIQIVGRASYSIYLIHFIIIIHMGQFVGNFTLPVRVLFLVIAGTLPGIAIYVVIERPIERWRNKGKVEKSH